MCRLHCLLAAIGKMRESSCSILQPIKESRLITHVQDVTIDQDGNIVVADFDNNRLQTFAATGVFIREFFSEGTDEGEFLGPSNISIDQDGNFLLCDMLNGRLAVCVAALLLLTAGLWCVTLLLPARPLPCCGSCEQQERRNDLGRRGMGGGESKLVFCVF